MTTYNFINRTGEVHGRLTVIGRSTEHKRTYWDCACACGNNTTVRGDHLKEGRVNSCGCIALEQMTIHGRARTPEYHSWQALKDRCNNPKNTHYANYGGRGIAVCSEWNDSFMAFFADMGERPTDKHTIERIENNGHYCQYNCKWATRKEQVDNRRNTILHTVNGKTQCLKDWCKEFNVSYSTTQQRIKRGWSIDSALKTPPNAKQVT